MKNKKKKIILSIVGVCVVLIGAYAVNLAIAAQSALKTMQQPIDKSDKRDQEISLEKKDPFSLALLGVDESEYDGGRTDTMIVATVNPEKKSIKMLSIPRDTRTEIVGKGTTEKINHAYVRGGTQMAVATIENFLDIPIDYYVQINLEGFKDMIDAFGGVTVANDMDLTFRKYHFPEGDLRLTGEEALVFSRIRYEDPRGDFGRQLRQRQIIEAILGEGTKMSSVLKYDDVLRSLGENVKTNISVKEIINLQKQYSGIEKNIEQYQFEKFNGGYIGDYWYFFPDEEEVAEHSSMLREHLEI